MRNLLILLLGLKPRKKHGQIARLISHEHTVFPEEQLTFDQWAHYIHNSISNIKHGKA